MDRAFSSGASASPPTPPASPSIGYPTSGNPGTGTPPTKPGAYWYHMMTEEIRNVLVAAGLTPEQGNLTQLLQALRSAGVFQTQPTNDSSTKAATTAFANPGSLLATNGYVKLPCGLIFQWGGATVSSTAELLITLPIAYPNALLNVALGNRQPVLGTALASYTGWVPNNNSSFYMRSSSGGGSAQFWQSIGW